MKFSDALFVLALGLVLLGWSLRRRRAGTFLCVNVAAVVSALALFEVWLGYQDARGDGTRMEGSIADGFTHRDDLLGYAPAKNARVTARKLYGDTRLYDVAYTTNGHGLRVTAPAAPSARACVVFFGDSITFGEGVNDTEDFPYLVSVKVAGRYATYNFAFSGYGPHQMLANLQSGRVARIVDCTPKHFFYLCIVDHAARVAGLSSWDRHGPRFLLQPDGSVVRQGHFDDPAPGGGGWLAASARRVLAGSLAWQKFFGRPYAIDARDIALLDGVIRESARVARERFPGSVFHVIMWDGSDEGEVRAIEDGLAGSGIRIEPMTAAVNDFYAHPEKYIISPHDRHPSATWHRMMADYISDGLLRESASMQSPSRLR